MRNRTYRYFSDSRSIRLLCLSYTTFSYSSLTLLKEAINAGDPLTAEVMVTNTGKRAGDEVAQFYLSFPKVPARPCGVARLQARELSRVNRGSCASS